MFLGLPCEAKSQGLAGWLLATLICYDFDLDLWEGLNIYCRI